MTNLTEVFNKLENIDSKSSDFSVFICHSNLHLIQALAIKCKNIKVCLYTEAVSKKFIEEYFDGVAIALPEFNRKTVTWCLNIRKTLLRVDLFLGCKQHYYSHVFANSFQTKSITVLDDGLASYGVSSELYIEQNKFKKALKSLMSKVLDIFSIYYFYESNSSVIDRKLTAYYFFPALSPQNPKVIKKQIDAEPIKKIVANFEFESSELFIASFELSKELLLKGHSLDNYILHPRAVGKANDYPSEFMLLRSKKVNLELSSLILFLFFMDFKGQIVLAKSEKMNELLSFVEKSIKLEQFDVVLK
jgi:hypothetical protein